MVLIGLKQCSVITDSIKQPSLVQTTSKYLKFDAKNLKVIFIVECMPNLDIFKENSEKLPSN